MGVTLGWVPVEEYTFFILQTLWVGLLLRWMAVRLPYDAGLPEQGSRYRWISTLSLGVIWICAVSSLISSWAPGTYVGLILVWAIPPILVQLIFGGDILWRNRRLVSVVLLVAVSYLSISDSLAIRSGTWTIDPNQSLKIFLGDILPVEEFLFFILTNVLIVLGMTLVLSKDSHARFRRLKERLRHNLLP
jgi:lycopene cyclase domain-containing protein